MKWAVVVPTNRPDQFTKFVNAWAHLFRKHGAHLIVVEDFDEMHPEIEKVLQNGVDYTVLCRKAFRHVPFAVPVGTDMIRSGGFKDAYDMEATYTMSLDDDVVPGFDDPFEQYELVFEKGSVVSPFLSVASFTDSPYQMRGFPFGDRAPQKVMVQYGGWRGTHDLDAYTQLWDNGERIGTFDPAVLPVPRGIPMTTCAMNFAFRTESTVAMWQFPLFEGRHNRMGDMWSGLVQKRVCDNVGQVMMLNGLASVHHTRASDPQVNILREQTSFHFGDKVWDWTKIQDHPLSVASAWILAVNHLRSNLKIVDPLYADHFARALVEWYEWVMA